MTHHITGLRPRRSVLYMPAANERALEKAKTIAADAIIFDLEDAVVEATLPYLPDIVADMVRVQRLTGARPGEACSLRPADIDRTEAVWKWKPPHHKTS